MISRFATFSTKIPTSVGSPPACVKFRHAGKSSRFRSPPISMKSEVKRKSIENCKNELHKNVSGGFMMTAKEKDFETELLKDQEYDNRFTSRDSDSMSINFDKIEFENNVVNEFYANCYHLNSKPNSISGWIIDSGASLHICQNFKYFTEFKKTSSRGVVKAANGAQLPIVGYGRCRLLLSQHKKPIVMKK